MFVDVRGFTALSERLRPSEVVERLNRFYKLSADIVFELDGTLDKMVGDQVMAFFGPPFQPMDHPQRAVKAALEIVAGVAALDDHEDPLRVEVGGGVGSGTAFVGNVAEGEVGDYTVIGDVVNTTARLQGAAQAGEVLVMQETYITVSELYSDAPEKTLQLKGKADPINVRSLSAGG